MGWKKEGDYWLSLSQHYELKAVTRRFASETVRDRLYHEQRVRDALSIILEWVQQERVISKYASRPINEVEFQKQLMMVKRKAEGWRMWQPKHHWSIFDGPSMMASNAQEEESSFENINFEANLKYL